MILSKHGTYTPVSLAESRIFLAGWLNVDLGVQKAEWMTGRIKPQSCDSRVEYSWLSSRWAGRSARGPSAVDPPHPLTHSPTRVRAPQDWRITNSGLTTTWREVLDFPVIESSNKLAAVCPISNVDHETVVSGTRNMSP